MVQRDQQQLRVHRLGGQPDRRIDYPRQFCARRVAGQHDDGWAVTQGYAQLFGHFGAVHVLVDLRVHDQHIGRKALPHLLHSLTACGGASHPIALGGQQQAHRGAHADVVVHMQDAPQG